eukprot:5048218-Amphidinium_carterae.1
MTGTITHPPPVTTYFTLPNFLPALRKSMYCMQSVACCLDNHVTSLQGHAVIMIMLVDKEATVDLRYSQIPFVVAKVKASMEMRLHTACHAHGLGR